MRVKIILGWIALFIVVLSSCERPLNPVAEGILTFDRDSVNFDSVFTTLLTPSERLIVHNEQNKDLVISRVWLERGDASEFDMIVDGIQGGEATDVVIARKDSMHIFVNLKSKEQDAWVEDYILFEIGDEIQRVLVRARVVDAYFLKARIKLENQFLNLDSGSFFFRRDTVLTPEKPIIMDGPIFIPEGVTVTVLPGTEIFFTPYKFTVRDSSNVPTVGLYSWLIVDGTLKAEGTVDLPIEFKSVRFDSAALENPAQWRGLRFLPSSKDNILRHCTVKNAQIGIEVDSIPVNDQPKLTVQYCQIRNMGVHGVVGVGVDGSGSVAAALPSILMENTVVNTCKQHTVLTIGGGKYDFFNCTFANFNLAWPRFSRRSPQIRLSNWFTFDGITADIYPSYTRFVNCAIWGSEEDEIVLDTLNGAPFDLLVFDHSLVRVSQDYFPAVSPHLKDAIANVDPLFNDFTLWDYRPLETSPLINAGVDNPQGSSGYLDDIRGRMDSLRYDGFDIGAWEYWPLE
ncbi:MAG: hypothetical protein AAFR61_17170 [Bacteroidota bacterium]